jgi:hypothetical protein
VLILDLAFFEESFINEVSTWKAHGLSAEGEGTLLAHLSTSGNDVRILNILGYVIAALVASKLELIDLNQ